MKMHPISKSRLQLLLQPPNLANHPNPANSHRKSEIKHGMENIDLQTHPDGSPQPLQNTLPVIKTSKETASRSDLKPQNLKTSNSRTKNK
mmetsp:Transcript_30117/g.34476  ORF Transcript_30117/g.34476 Transcript_30117/m.34476 type:complete len:90 (+) Transcript_30117:131-400(+)